MRHLILTSLLALSLGASAHAPRQAQTPAGTSGQAPAPKAPTAATMNLLGPGVGLEGFDPVSYWPEGGGKPKQGTIKLTYMYEGVAYRFANDKNLATFKTNPSHFLPQYGGYCAWALGAINQRVDVNPNHFVIRDGKLYLFFSDANVVTRDLWKKDAAALVEKADTAYGKLIAQ